MSDRLPRNIPPSGGGDRYGAWQLSSDREGTEEPLEDSWDSRISEPWEEESQEQVARLIVRQRRLSIAATAVLVGTLLIVVTLGHVYPEAMSTPVWRGFGPAWLFIGILIYPVTWLVALVYVIVSNRMDGLS